MTQGRRILLFCLIAFAISWAYWLWMLAEGRIVGPGSSASHLPGLMGPMIAALIVTALSEGRRGLADLASRMVRLPARPGWFLAALAMPPVVAAAVFAVQALRGVPPPPLSAFAAYPGLADGSGVWGLIGVLVLNGYGEEVGWRGWLFEAFDPARNRFAAALLVAGVWMVWHLPTFWINLSVQALVGPMLVGWAIGLVLGSFVLAHVYSFTGRSLAAVVLWHVTYNFCVSTTATSGLVAAVVSTAVMVWGAMVAIGWARQPRMAAT
jgi:uncharacterized protein